MSYQDLIRWSVRQIRKRFLESLLIILGIGLGIAVICGVVGLVDSFEKQEKEKAQSKAMRTLFVNDARYTLTSNDPEAPLQRVQETKSKGHTVTYQDYLDLRNAKIEGIEYVWVSQRNSEPLHGSWVAQPNMRDMTVEERIKWEYDNMVNITLVTPEVFEMAGLSLVQGDLIRDSDVENEIKVAVLGDELAREYFGDNDPVGKTISLWEGTFTVIGVVHRDVQEKKDINEWKEIPLVGLEHLLNKHMYVPLFSYPTESRRFGKDFIFDILVLPEEGINMEVAKNRLRNYLTQKYNGGVGITGWFIYQEASNKSWISIGKMVGVLASVALLIAAINILNLMMARVLRRYKQIGISAALGANRRDLFNLFLTEAIILGVLGSLVGIILAYGGLVFFSQIIDMKMSLTLLTAAVGIGLALITTLIFGLYPAIQAAKIQPVEALKAD